jgi:hypothetical protein
MFIQRDKERDIQIYRVDTTDGERDLIDYRAGILRSPEFIDSDAYNANAVIGGSDDVVSR